MYDKFTEGLINFSITEVKGLTVKTHKFGIVKANPIMHVLALSWHTQHKYGTKDIVH